MRVCAGKFSSAPSPPRRELIGERPLEIPAARRDPRSPPRASACTSLECRDRACPFRFLFYFSSPPPSHFFLRFFTFLACVRCATREPFIHRLLRDRDTPGIDVRSTLTGRVMFITSSRVHVARRVFLRLFGSRNSFPIGRSFARCWRNFLNYYRCAFLR